jgi:hypothetical protein
MGLEGFGLSAVGFQLILRTTLTGGLCVPNSQEKITVLKIFGTLNDCKP